MSTRTFCDRCNGEIDQLHARYVGGITAKNEFCLQDVVHYEDLCGSCASQLLHAWSEVEQ